MYESIIGFGVITTNQVPLPSSSFLGDPPTFTLIGETRGGPPTLYTWTRNAGQITSNSSFSISISVKSSAVERFRESLYVSTLVVRGNLPGVYQYSVTNRAMTNSRDGSFSIEGGAGVRNLMAVQTGLAGVRVSWTAPPLVPVRGYQITTTNTNETTSATSHNVNIAQPGHHTIQVLPLSQHLPYQPTSVQVTLNGKNGDFLIENVAIIICRYISSKHHVITGYCHISQHLLDSA